jgi:hypothetical protein
MSETQHRDLTEQIQMDCSDRNLNVAEEILTATLGRCDGKASLLLGMTGAGLALLISGVRGMHLPATAFAIGALGVIAWIGAMILLLISVRPHLMNDDYASWPHWARMSPAEIREAMRRDRRADRIKVLATKARMKFRCIRLGIDLILSGVVLLTIATIAAIAT